MTSGFLITRTSWWSSTSAITTSAGCQPTYPGTCRLSRRSTPPVTKSAPSEWIDQQPWTPGFPHRYLPQHPLRAPHHQPGPSGHIHCPGRAGLHPGHQPTAHGLCSQHCSKFVFCSAWSCCNVLDGSFRGPVERLMNSKFTKFFICNLLKFKKQK